MTCLESATLHAMQRSLFVDLEKKRVGVLKPLKGYISRSVRIRHSFPVAVKIRYPGYPIHSTFL
jgi:hypothetical protein